MPFIGETSIRTGAAGAGGYTIDQSIRFNDNDSAYLSRTFGTPTDATNWTFSTWVKRCNLGTEQWFFNSGASAAAYYIRFESTDKIRFRASTSWDITTNEFFRDVSAWYHIVATFENGSVTLYINNQSIATASVSDATYNFFTNIIHSIGGSTTGASNSDLYMAETHGIDGQALAPTNFGEYNDDGVWIPKQFEGSYGNNGFYITGADSADLGADESGNANDFTSSGLAAVDQVTDSPTDNYATLNTILKHGSVTLADGNLEVSSGTNGWFGSVGTVGIKLGDKVYFEGKCLTNTRLYFGLSRINGSGGTINPQTDSTFEGGQSDTDYMWRVTDADTVYYQTTDQSVTVSAVAVNDIVGCSVDTDGTVKFYKNGTEIHSFSTTLVAGDTYMPVYSVNGATSTEKWEVRFGSTSISHQPAGFNLLRTSDMADPIIADPSAYFQTSLWSGNGSTQTITQDGNSTFQPGWIWSKGRDNVQEHTVFDEVRGTTKYLKVTPAGTEATQSGVTAFNSDGFDLGSWAVTNGSGQTHVGWQWKAGGTSGSSNTDGSITSTVSADTTSRFSIVGYTGNATSGATVGHGLGVAPDVIIVKNRDASDAWQVYHSGVASDAETDYLVLNATNAVADNVNRWNDTAPTSSVFSLGNAVEVNTNTEDYIAYCFAEVEGFSKFGSYKGNGSANGPFIYTGFMPEFIMIKSSSNSGTNWDILDATREPFNDRGNQFEANTTDAEANNDHNCDFLSNGFKWRDGSGSNNGSGYTIIYMAFARSPFKTSLAQ